MHRGAFDISSFAVAARPEICRVKGSDAEDRRSGRRRSGSKAERFGTVTGLRCGTVERCADHLCSI